MRATHEGAVTRLGAAPVIVQGSLDFRRPIHAAFRTKDSGGIVFPGRLAQTLQNQLRSGLSQGDVLVNRFRFGGLKGIRFECQRCSHGGIIASSDCIVGPA
jgi:hypothetical protein